MTTKKKKIRVGVVGVGYLGSLHAQKYANMPEAELVGVTDVSLSRAEEVASLTNTTALAGHREMFGRVDAVSIVTPTVHHCPIGLEFIERGIDVLIEKPIAVTLEEADRLVAAAKKTNAILQVGHLERFNAAIAALEGRLKNPMFINAERLSPFPNRSTDVDVILDLMIHDIDIILDLVKSDIVSVDAVGLPVVSDKIDAANARIVFKNGCVANVTASRVSKERARKILIYQSGEYISVDYAAQRISVMKPSEDAATGLSTQAEEIIEIEKRDALMEELRDFLCCSADRRAPLVSGVAGRMALEVALAVQKAAGRSMSIFLQAAKSM